jgi:hypothetical protein
MKQYFVVAIVIIAAAPAGMSFGRGFGGFHGGGFGGGGFGGGGFHGGGFGGGGYGGGGFHGGGFGGGMSGFHQQNFGGGFGGGDFHAGGYGGGGYGGGMGGFHPDGMSGGMGMGGYGGGFHAGNGMSEFHDYGGVRPGGMVGGLPPSLGGFRAGGFDALPSGGELNRFTDNSAALGMHAGLSDAVNRGDLNQFLGLPTDGGMPLARTAEFDHPAAADIANHPIAADAAAHPYATGQFSPTHDHVQALAAQSWFNDHPAFTPGWVAHHRWGWTPNDEADEVYWASNYWNALDWATVGNWLNEPSAAPQNYDYGNNVVYQGDNVVVNSQPVGNPTQYYSQAEALAITDARQDAAKDPAYTDGKKIQWLPIGVFALMKSDKDKPEMVFQLALDKQGIIRGNYFSEVEDKTQPVYGSVDKKTQLAAWHVGDNKKVIVETGLYNLTKDEASALVHMGPDHEERYVLVRLKSNESQAKGQK